MAKISSSKLQRAGVDALLERECRHGLIDIGYSQSAGAMRQICTYVINIIGFYGQLGVQKGRLL